MKATEQAGGIGNESCHLREEREPQGRALFEAARLTQSGNGRLSSKREPHKRFSGNFTTQLSNRTRNWNNWAG